MVATLSEGGGGDVGLGAALGVLLDAGLAEVVDDGIAFLVLMIQSF